MITFNRFGIKGNLGNQLFQLASMIGFSKKYNQELRMPPWQYSRYFNPMPVMLDSRLKGLNNIDEGNNYHYSPEFWDQMQTGDWNVSGWLQTEKYWEHCKNIIRQAFQWDTNFERHVMTGRPYTDFTDTIAISVRRGDYVGNPNYDLLPVSYYMQALMKEFPDYLTKKFLIFSDDIPYCKIHFEGLPNVWFAEGLSPVVQLCMMSHCENFVIANSTFSWWGAYLAELNGRAIKIVRPEYLFAGDLLKSCDDKDHWPERWTSYDHKDADGYPKKYPLKDVTFTIPVMYDHQDRKRNLELMVCLLQKAFDTHIIIGEAIVRDDQSFMFDYFQEYGCHYMQWRLPYFHRTRMLNQMAADTSTPIVANWDADVCVPEVQIVVAVEKIRKGILDGAYPYDGRFARVPRKEWFPRLEKELDLGVFKGVTTFKGTQGQFGANSVGGAVFWNRVKFLEGGGENENFISYAPEDGERWERFQFLGYRVGRIIGQLFHMDHWIGPDSKSQHNFKLNNDHVHQQLKDILASGDVNKMWSWIKSWPWYEEYNKFPVRNE